MPRQWGRFGERDIKNLEQGIKMYLEGKEYYDVRTVSYMKLLFAIRLQMFDTGNYEGVLISP